MKKLSFSSFLALVQGVYYLVTGIWPILSRRSFESITGPKVDFWLVRTIGALISAVGGTLVLAGLRGEVPPEARLLGISSAAGLGGSDIIYSTRGRISKVYLAESLVELGLVGLWAAAMIMGNRQKRR